MEQVLPSLVAYGLDGQPETVKYHVLPTLVLAEVQRLERERAAAAVERAALTAQVAQQATAIAELRALVGDLRRQLADGRSSTPARR